MTRQPVPATLHPTLTRRARFLALIKGQQRYLPEPSWNERRTPPIQPNPHLLEF